MGFWDAVTGLVEAAAPWSVAHAEAPAEESKEEESTDDTKDSKDESTDESEDKEEGSDEEGEGEGEEEEEEEDDDEPVDPAPKIEEECRESKKCAPAKHHYDACVERVTHQIENEGGPKEDCVEEFFHLTHCATQCAAPKLWKQLK